MTKQKRGFLLFLSSLIPGAGEMYMGFRKQGISIMLLFWGTIALAATTGFSALLMLIPIIWFYSFFNVHNLKSLSEEEFYSLEDNYVLHLEQLLGNADILVTKYHTLVAVLLIFFGVSILWNNFMDFIYWFLPSPVANLLSAISYRLPQLIIAVAIIAAGCYILSHKKARLDDDYRKTTSEEHYWEPYRPYHKESSAEAPDDSTRAAEDPASTRNVETDSFFAQNTTDSEKPYSIMESSPSSDTGNTGVSE